MYLLASAGQIVGSSPMPCWPEKRITIRVGMSPECGLVSSVESSGPSSSLFFSYPIPSPYSCFPIVSHDQTLAFPGGGLTKKGKRIRLLLFPLTSHSPLSFTHTHTLAVSIYGEVPSRPQPSVTFFVLSFSEMLQLTLSELFYYFFNATCYLTVITLSSSLDWIHFLITYSTVTYWLFSPITLAMASCYLSRLDPVATIRSHSRVESLDQYYVSPHPLPQGIIYPLYGVKTLKRTHLPLHRDGKVYLGSCASSSQSYFITIPIGLL